LRRRYHWLCSTVGFHQRRMVDRDVAGTLLKIRHRIAALLHHFADQLIRLQDDAFRIIDEPSLKLCTGLAESRGARQREPLRCVEYSITSRGISGSEGLTQPLLRRARL
jgi:hypothetical protein